MEKRAGPRFPVDKVVFVTPLDGGSAQFQARMQDLSGTGMRLLLPLPVSSGTLLKVEWDDTLLLGEVCYCDPADGGFAAGLELQHALLQTGELARLSRRLLHEGEPVPARQQHLQ